jgi:hypothetical protein
MWYVTHTTRVQQRGSLKAQNSRIGNNLGHYSGFMENVCSLALRSAGVISDFKFHSGFLQERRHVCLLIRLCLSWACSSIINYHQLCNQSDIESITNTGPTYMAYFFYLFQGQRKTGCSCFPLFSPCSTQQPISLTLHHPSRVLLRTST